MEYKAIGFDYGGVINGSPASQFNADVCNLIGVDDDSYKAAYYTHNGAFNRGEVDARGLWTRILNDLERTDMLATVLNLIEERNKSTINLEILELVDTLRKKGYKVGLLSNNSFEAAEKMRAEHTFDHFDVAQVSAITSFVKPSLEAFAYFAEQLDVPLQSLIFIDDSPKSLSTAEDCGFTPILFESYDQLVGDLRKLEIL